MEYKLKKKTQGFQEAGPGRGKTLGQNDPVFSTAQQIADEHGVSEKTVKRAEKFIDDLSKLPAREGETADGSTKGTFGGASWPPRGSELVGQDFRCWVGVGQGGEGDRAL